jgi:Putative Ig domain
MRTVSRGISGLLLAWMLLALTACGGGGGGSPSHQSATLSYPSGTQTFVVGTAIAALTPTITGTLTTFSVSPALPAGLILDTSKGSISGTPSAVSAATTYTVSASGPGSASASATVSIMVNDVPPSQVSYGATRFTFSSGIAASTLTPTSAGGTVVSWSITPALPQGLSFSTTDGSISGTPTAPVAAAQYVVTAQNSGTVTLTITVDAAPFVTLGHQAAVSQVRVSATNAVSEDFYGTWILWDYAHASILASGNSGCGTTDTGFLYCGLISGAGSPIVDVAGTTAAVVVPTGLEMHSTSDGHVLADIAASGSWWRLATDGSYVAVGSNTSLSAWSPSGQLLFSHAGNYSQAIPFAAPGQVSVGAGPAGANVIETIAVPSGTSSTGAVFNGTFSSWFTDGGRFIATAGTSALIYSSAAVQQGAVTSFSGTLVGQGNWVWAVVPYGGPMNIYSATATTASTSPAFTYALGALAVPIVSGMTVGSFTEGSNTISVVDFSGAVPVKTDYTSSVYLGFASGSNTQAYAAVSSSQWLVGTEVGVLVDGATLGGGTVRQFGYGEALGIAAGSAHFAIATGSGNILYFNSATLAQEGQIPFYASKVVLSADGTLLIAQGAGSDFGQNTVNVYSLPAGTLLYTWSYGSGTQAASPDSDIQLSASGAVLGQLIDLAGSGATTDYNIEASAPTGGSQVFSATFTPSSSFFYAPPPMRISPDGTLIAYSQAGWPVVSPTNAIPGTNLLQNGSFVTAFSGLVAGWLDNSRLLVNNYISGKESVIYSGCALYGSNGVATGAACALPYSIYQFQPVTADQIYVPLVNQILSVSTGAVVWASGNPDAWIQATYQTESAVTGTQAIFVSGIDAVAQSF